MILSSLFEGEKMLKLTRFDGEAVYVDYTKIVTIQPSRRGDSETLVVFDGDEIVVKEPAKDIAFYCQFKQSYNSTNPQIDTVGVREHTNIDDESVLDDIEAILSYAKRYLDEKIQEVESSDNKNNYIPTLDYYKNIRDKINDIYFDKIVSVTLRETTGEQNASESQD